MCDFSSDSFFLAHFIFVFKQLRYLLLRKTSFIFRTNGFSPRLAPAYGEPKANSFNKICSFGTAPILFTLLFVLLERTEVNQT